MLTKEITYTDYDGNTRTETHRFNLTTTELMEMQVSVEGGLTKMIEGSPPPRTPSRSWLSSRI